MSSVQGPRKRRFSVLALLAVVAVCALVARLQPPRREAIDVARLSVEGVSVGMTGDDVVAARGEPAYANTEVPGQLQWTWRSGHPVILSGRAGPIVQDIIAGDQSYFPIRDVVVVQVEGERLDLGSEPLIEKGDTESRVRDILSSRGEPEVCNEPEGCAFSVPFYHLLTMGIFMGFNGSLFYPGIGYIAFDDGQVSRIILCKLLLPAL